jgi:hypothetical protein
MALEGVASVVFVGGSILLAGVAAPLSGTPEPERLLLEELLERSAGGKCSVGSKLEALAKAIRIRQGAVEQLRWESGRSLRLARWGWVGTAGFSIPSILLGILALGG